MYLSSLLFVCLLCISTLTSAIQQNDLDNARQHFEEFIQKYEKHYTEREKELRFKIFIENWELINNSNNEGDNSYGINQFSDLTREEFIQTYTGYNRGESGCGHIDGDDFIRVDSNIPDVVAPESFDWREQNIVTPVKNQRDCGSCWAFATAAYLESQYAMKYKKQIDLSEQQILDCDKESCGCCGGFAFTALKAIKKVGGLLLENDYNFMYQAKDRHTCEVDESKVQVKVKNVTMYRLSSQEKVKQLLFQNGPIIIGIKATALHHHRCNIIMSDVKCNVDELNHQVLLVGYGSENNKPYWIVKNSWGVGVEEDGYFRMERNGESWGACGMMTDALITAVIE